MKIVVIFALMFSFVFALDIDTQSLKHEIENDATNINARLLLANDCIKNKKLDEAKNYINQVLALDKDNQKAQKLLEKITDKPKIKPTQTISREQKLELIYKKSDKFSDFKEYFFELDGLGKKDKSFKKLEEYVQVHPRDEDAVLFLANRYYWNNQSKKSAKLIKPFVKKTNNPKLLTLHANLLYQAGRDYKALQTFRKVVALGGETKEIKKSMKQLVQTTEKKVTKKSKSTSKNRAEKYFFQKQYTKAIKYYKRYFKHTSNDNLARFHYATSLENVKAYKKATKQYKRVSNKRDNLYLLSTYRYGRTLMEQKQERTWEKAQEVFSSLIDTIISKEPTKESDEILKFTQQALNIVSQPMPKPTLHHDVYLTAQQTKILDQATLDGSLIVSNDITSVKSLLNPNIETDITSTNIRATVYGAKLSDDNLDNSYMGVEIANDNISVNIKKSNFKDSAKKQEVEVTTLTASYSNNDNLTVEVGVNSFEEDTSVVGKLEYKKAYDKHNITYGIGYQNAIFLNGATCSEKNDIDVVSLSLYDVLLLKNLKQSELILTLNSYSDGNLNINGWINYPLLENATGNLVTIFSATGSYEYNSKKDTCYYAADFFDKTGIEARSKYQFKNGFVQLSGDIGYSLKEAKVLYSYGLLLQLSTGNSYDISIDCKHYQSGYSPDGANECYASLTHVW